MLFDRNSKLMEIFVSVLVTRACIYLQIFQQAISKGNACIGWKPWKLLSTNSVLCPQLESHLRHTVPQEVTFIFSSFETETWTLSIGRNRLGLTLSIRSELHPKVSPKLFAGGGQYHPYLTKPDPVYDRKLGFSIPSLCIKYKDPYKAHPVYEKFCWQLMFLTVP